MIKRSTTVNLFKEYLNFSAAHFTIFSATERERLHGHNFGVSASITAPITHNGMTCDYSIYKEKMKTLCDGLDEYTLLPAQSPYLRVEQDGDSVVAEFNGETMRFLRSDTLVLPIENTTIEEFAFYLLGLLLEDDELLNEFAVSQIEVKVSSGPGQTANALWHRPD